MISNNGQYLANRVHEILHSGLKDEGYDVGDSLVKPFEVLDIDTHEKYIVEVRIFEVESKHSA